MDEDTRAFLIGIEQRLTECIDRNMAKVSDGVKQDLSELRRAVRADRQAMENRLIGAHLDQAQFEARLTLLEQRVLVMERRQIS